MARNAPPVPTMPVMKPEILPPVIVVLVFAANFSDGLSRNKTDNAIKNIPRISCKILCAIAPTREAPKKLRTTLGIPNVIIIFLSNPRLKKLILPMFPIKWDIATSINAVLKSTKNNAKGKKMVEEPNPATAPITSDIKAIRRNSNDAGSNAYVCCSFLRYIV